jgi:hypothetical protein
MKIKGDNHAALKLLKKPLNQTSVKHIDVVQYLHGNEVIVARCSLVLPHETECGRLLDPKKGTFLDLCRSLMCLTSAGQPASVVCGISLPR